MASTSDLLPARPVLYNPYLERLHSEVGYDDLTSWDNKKQFRSSSRDYRTSYRWWMVIKYSWAIPSEQVIRYMASKASRIVEIGAGTGYWAMLLAQAGADVVALDEEPPDGTFPVDDDATYLKMKELTKAHWHSTQEAWFPVGRGVAEEAAEYSDRTLFLCWPPYAEPMAYDALRAYKGSDVFFVGEDDDGCTGDEDFHRELSRCWTLVEEIEIEQWCGIHDRFFHYQRPALPRGEE